MRGIAQFLDAIQEDSGVSSRNRTIEHHKTSSARQHACGLGDKSSWIWEVMRCNPAGGDLERTVVEGKIFGVRDRRLNVRETQFRKGGPRVMQDLGSEVAR